MSWLIVLKDLCKSMRIIPVSRPESKPFSILSIKFEIEVSVKSFMQSQIGIYRECYLFDIPRVLLSQ